MVGGSRPVVLLLAGAVIVVLLVACANVANLLLARGTGRLRELALRAAIGADRGRLMRQMLTESAALSLLGAAGGLGVALVATRALTVLAAAGIPRADQIGIDGVVLGFAMAASLVTSVVFGLVPALHLSRQDLNDALKEGGKQQGAAVGRGAREALIVAEVALSIVLLVGAGLLIRSLQRLQDVNPGFNTEQVVTMESVAAGGALRGRRADAVLSAARGARAGHRRRAQRRRRQHPAAQQQLRQPRHPDRGRSEAGRPGAEPAVRDRSRRDTSRRWGSR